MPDDTTLLEVWKALDEKLQVAEEYKRPGLLTAISLVQDLQEQNTPRDRDQLGAQLCGPGTTATTGSEGGDAAQSPLAIRNDRKNN